MSHMINIKLDQFYEDHLSQDFTTKSKETVE